MAEKATETSTVKKKGPVIEAALCRCCRSIKKCRLLNHEYEWNDTKEVYSEMFMDTFGLLLSHLDDAPTGRGVCATCVLRLRDAVAFHRQVLQCEELLLRSKLESVDIPRVKSEPESDSDAPLAAFDNRSPSSPEPDLAIPKSEIKSEKVKSKVNIKTQKVNTPRVNAQRVIASRVNAPKKREKVRRSGRMVLLSNMKKIRKDVLMQANEPKPKREFLNPKFEDENEYKAYYNAVCMIKNSYICPFHNRVSMYYCIYCREQFTNPEELRQHTWEHDTKIFEKSMEKRNVPKVDITRIDCRLCPERINDLPSLREHLKTHDFKIYDNVGNEFLTFKLSHNVVTCTECGQNFPYFDSLKKHMVEHFGKYICDQCGACFVELPSLRTHIKSHSKIDTNFPCEICGKNLKSKYSRYLHIATVHEKKPTVNCYKCDSSFLSYALRNKHMIEVHGDDRVFKCKLCDKIYNRRKTLMEHNRRSHQKVMKHQCELCSQRFYIPSRLKEHMANHTGGKTYKCSCCDKTFTRLLTLHQHLRDKARDS